MTSNSLKEEFTQKENSLQLYTPPPINLFLRKNKCPNSWWKHHNISQLIHTTPVNQLMSWEAKAPCFNFKPCFRAKMQGLCGVTKVILSESGGEICTDDTSDYKWKQSKISVDVDPASACVRQLIISHWFPYHCAIKLNFCHFANGCYHSHRLRMPTLSETEWLPRHFVAHLQGQAASSSREPPTLCCFHPASVYISPSL